MPLTVKEASQESLVHFLDRHHIPYQIVPNINASTLSDIAEQHRLPKSSIVRSVFCKDENGILMVVLPISHMLDCTRLNLATGRSLRPLKEAEVQFLFGMSVPGAHPLLPYELDLRVILDDSLKNISPLYFTPGNYSNLIRMNGEDYQQLLGGEVECLAVSIPLSLLLEYEDAEEEAPIARMAHYFAERRFYDRLKETKELPILPYTLHELLRLRQDKTASAAHLAQVIERDPSLAAQIMSWAIAPYQGWHTPIVSVEQAIMLLGFDLMLNLAMGLSFGRMLHVAMDGVIGIQKYFKQSVCMATLMEELVVRMPSNLQPARGLAYLAGLLHNLGHLLLAYLFPPQFSLLSDHILANPEVNVAYIERHVLGVSQNILASWLLEIWKLPPETISAVRWYTHETYAGKHAVYARLLLISNRLLRRAGMGFASSTALPVWLLDSLGLTESDTIDALEAIVKNNEKWETWTQQIMQ